MILDLEAVIADYWSIEWPKKASAGDTYEIDNSGLTIALANFKYSIFDPTTVPESIDSATFVNGVSAPASELFENTKTTTSTNSFSVTSGLKLGAEASFNVGLPVIAGGTVKASAEVSFSSSFTQTDTETQSWTYAVTIPVPAHTIVVATCNVATAYYSPTFTADLAISGLSKAVSTKGLGFLQIDPVSLFSGIKGFTFGGGKAIFSASGTFAGVQGTGRTIIATESPYNPDGASATSMLE